MVEIKRKVTIKKKTPQDEISSELHSSTGTLNEKKEPQTSSMQELEQADASTTKQNKSFWKGVVVALIVLIVVALIYFFVIKKDGDASRDSPAFDPIAQNDSTENGANDSDSVDTVAAVGQDASAPAVKDSEVMDDAASSSSSASRTSTTAQQPASSAKTSVTDTSNHQIPKVVVSSSFVEEKAKQVIRGNFGNGQVRKDKLGDEYSMIQSKVNEMYRQGLVK